jgi:hypothetical protein
MKLRLLKHLSLAIGIVVSLLVLIIAVNYYFPSTPRTYEASAKLPGSTSQIIVQLEPMHPYLAEYRRTLVLRKSGVPDQRVEMFSDTGGYSRTQLYRLDNGLFLVHGFFDAVIIDPTNHSLVVMPETQNITGSYLGAFDKAKDRQWQFINANQSPEQSLVAKSGS